MDKLKLKHKHLLQALVTLQKTLEIFKKLCQRGGCCCSTGSSSVTDNEEEYRIHRDSVIQRFEYSIDLFWKYLKKYLEHTNLLAGAIVPTDVVKRACAEKIITENEAELILEMIRNRNLTSHMYVEEIAEQLARLVPEYCNVLLIMARRLIV